jgi:methyl-accepting chemotaxis protein
MIEIAKTGGASASIIQAMQDNRAAYHFNSVWESGLEFSLQFFLIGLVAKAFIKPITALIESMHAIEKGDLTRGVVVTALDEIGSLQQISANVISKLSHILGDVETSGKQMEQSAFQIATIAKNIAEVGHQESSRSAEVVAATHELTTIAQEVKSHAETAAIKTRQVEQSARDGVAAVQRNIAELDSATSEVSLASAEVAQLEEAAKKIAHIIVAIREISGQTNLLALNAAIEAARAGEQGRGFAVVADEVRKLAERTNVSALEVDDIVSEITGKVVHLSEAMTAVVERVHGSQKVATETAVVMTSMASGVSDAAHSNDAIVEESRLQMDQLGQLESSLNRLFATLKESSTKVEATAVISGDLHKVTGDLNGIMSGFTFNRETMNVSKLGNDKRRHPRLARGLLAKLESADGTVQDSLTEDLSLTGAQMVLKHSLPEKAKIKVFLYVPHPDLEQYRDQKPVALRALVRWQKQNEGRLTCGIEFENMSASEKKHLEMVFSYYNQSPEY